MSQRRKFGSKHALGLVVLLVVIVIGGRFIAGHNSKVAMSDSPTSPSFEIKNQSDISKSQQSSNTNSNSNTTATGQNTASATSDESITACAEDLKNQTTAAKTDYEKGSVLVGFKTGVIFDQAKAVLATYGVTIQNTADAKASYPDRRLITGGVGKGEEFVKICFLKRNASVRYADLNKLFTLHD